MSRTVASGEHVRCLEIHPESTATRLAGRAGQVRPLVAADMNKHSHQPHPLDGLIDLLCDRIADRVAVRLQPIPEQDAWLDLSDAAEYLRLHPDTLRKRAKAGLIPFEQDAPRCRLFFRRTDLDAWRHVGSVPARLADVADLASRRASQ